MGSTTTNNNVNNNISNKNNNSNNDNNDDNMYFLMGREGGSVSIGVSLYILHVTVFVSDQ